ncbi:DUF6919 domain-containing protein [Thermomonospora umbrina]|uniref:DUF6919 domain-containing protein n=1 Tax=Thermomonospora umbrina TaxID=111806 RepID=A0A3D9T0K4_9ACTN|nr:hypothetical protein [Thermomonospora umbrina]REF00331.1 hypothetical protein DFJ69_5863 [Thermomonospora umbrina]
MSPRRRASVLRELVIGVPLMKRSERKLWASAQSLTDLAELTARWLAGELEQTPGYLGPPNLETAEIAPTLIRINRAGFLTTASQPGADEVNARGHWRQRAAVEIVASPGEHADLLLTEARRAGLQVVVFEGAPRRVTQTEVPVTTRDGGGVTSFGVGLSRRDVATYLVDGCSKAATRDVVTGWQITIIDPEWGPTDTLWRVLDKVADQVTGQPQNHLTGGAA